MLSLVVSTLCTYIILPLLSFLCFIICALFGCIYGTTLLNYLYSLWLYLPTMILYGTIHNSLSSSFPLHYLCSLWLYLSTVRNSHFFIVPASLSVLSLVVSTLCTYIILPLLSFLCFIICALFGCIYGTTLLNYLYSLWLYLPTMILYGTIHNSLSSSFPLHYLCSLWLYLSTVRNSHFLIVPACSFQLFYLMYVILALLSFPLH